MVLDLLCCGEWIQVTAQYSNAVMLAVLPHFTEFAKKLELPVPIPITTNDVVRFDVTPKRGRIEGGIRLKNGYLLGFQEGHVFLFESPHCFFGLQDPADIPKFYGPLRMSPQEAVELVRRTILKSGYSLEDVLAELEPQIELAQGVGTNVVPHYEIAWVDPRGGRAVSAEVNANQMLLERLRFIGRVTLHRPAPRVGSEPAEVSPDTAWGRLNHPKTTFNPDYATKLVPIVFRAIEDLGYTLGWDIPRRVKESDVKRFYISDQGGWPHCEITFTNGWEFKYRHAGISSIGSPRRFFDSDNLTFRLNSYIGQWRLTEAQALEVARREVAKLGYPNDRVHTDASPRVFRPTEIKNGPRIPRLKFDWNYPDLEHREQWIQVEVDCDRGTVESLAFDDVSLWDKRPPIDVPITRKEPTPRPSRN